MTRPLRFSFRLLFGLGFAACAGAMATALYIEYGLGFEPCPLCVFQRIVVIAMGVVFLIGALHAPDGRRGRLTYVTLTTLIAAIGMGLAGRHVWIQHLPADQVPACGPTLQYLLEILPFKEVLMTVLRGDASCANVQFRVLGLSLPECTLIMFIGFFFYSLATPALSRKEPA